MKRGIVQIGKKFDLLALLKVAYMKIRERWVFAGLGGVVFGGSLFIFDGFGQPALMISGVAVMVIMLLIVSLGKVLHRMPF